MPIIFQEETKSFFLTTEKTTYALHVNEGGWLIHDYYGAAVPVSDLRYTAERSGAASFAPKSADGTCLAQIAPQELSANGCGDYRVSALQIRNGDGYASTDIRYVSHKIYAGKPGIPGQPATYAESDGEATTLEIVAADKITGAEVTLYYTVFEQYNALTRRISVKNTSNRPMDLERIYSACYDMPRGEWDLCHLYGAWAKERQFERAPLICGIQSVESKRGASGHTHNPFVMLAAHDATEETGEAFGFNLVYTGNFSAQIEKVPDGDVRLIFGINPQDFSWKLDSGETFDAPEVVSVYSANGIGEMSRTFHKFYRERLCRGKWKLAKRPLLINNWEGTYFNFDEEKIFAIAKDASELGIEMLVLDDGWFGARNNDKAGLGDWYVNEQKLKGGMAALSARIHGLGMKFGLWFEPEMVNPDSDLYRAHPDWTLHAGDRPLCRSRNQYVLDLSRADVRDYLFERMDSILTEAKIDYVKWDFNRNLTEVGSALLPAERQKEIFHRYVLGVYDLLERLLTAHPDLLLEGCSGGGGRFDPAMLYYSPQFWTSDDTDAIERLSIQYGTSMCYPVTAVSSHVSACPNHQTGRISPLSTRGDVALAGTFGYELDMTKMTEEEKQTVRGQVEEYHKYYDLIHFGDLYRLIPPGERECAWCYVAADRSEALLTYVCVRTTQQLIHFVRFRGLDPQKNYTDGTRTLPGSVWMNAGTFLAPRMKDGESRKIHLTEVK